MLLKNPENCSRAFFKNTTCCCEDVYNNFSESYNSAIDKARELPLVEMLETIRRQAMVRIEIRRKKTMKHIGRFSPKLAETIELEKKHKKNCKTFVGPNGSFEVTENRSPFRVHLKDKTCSCQMWDVTGIPCRHVQKVISDRKLQLDDFISPWYLTSTWQAQYSDSILPLNGTKFWRNSGETTVQAPPRDILKGRKKTHKRIKSKHESPTKKIKLGRQGRTMHCGNCGVAGHNKRRCRTKTATDTGAESMSVGPSHPTQNSSTIDLA